jgi:lysophospholipase L1-like esterase
MMRTVAGSVRPTRQSGRFRVAVLGCLAVFAAHAAPGVARQRMVAAGDGYVAMGSSYAAGPGVPSSADNPPDRCARSTGNYAHLLANRLHLRLTDVSCSGAVTQNILQPWNELPAQLAALHPDTRLVTVTIGGNDVGYIAGLGGASCRRFASPPPGTPAGGCPPTVSRPGEEEWTRLATSLRQIAAGVRERSPTARLIFVDYLSLLPPAGVCAAVPLSQEQADTGRAIARRLSALTARDAADAGAEILAASRLSAGHDPCGADPWTSGFPVPGGPGFVPYHPNAAGMAAVADALARRVSAQGGRQ